MKEVSPDKAWEFVFPQQVALVTSVDREGRPNIITLGWHMHTSFSPPMVAISIGKTRYSHSLISQGKEFVYSIPPFELKDAAFFCGTCSGKKVDKFKETGLTSLPAKLVKPPLIEEAVVNMECRVEEMVITGDHTIFVGRILCSWLGEKKPILLTVEKGYRFGKIS